MNIVIKVKSYNLILVSEIFSLTSNTTMEEDYQKHKCGTQCLFNKIKFCERK